MPGTKQRGLYGTVGLPVTEELKQAEMFDGLTQAPIKAVTKLLFVLRHHKTIGIFIHFGFSLLYLLHCLFTYHISFRMDLKSTSK